MCLCRQSLFGDEPSSSPIDRGNYQHNIQTGRMRADLMGHRHAHLVSSPRQQTTLLDRGDGGCWMPGEPGWTQPLRSLRRKKPSSVDIIIAPCQKAEAKNEQRAVFGRLKWFDRPPLFGEPGAGHGGRATLGRSRQVSWCSWPSR